MVEASQAFRQVVLVMVTSDRPLEPHDAGPNQVINQMLMSDLKF